MLVFNCTKAAVEFFTLTRKGEKISPLESAPTPLITDTTHNEHMVSQWLVHTIKVQRKSVLIAMHIHTRYAMVFCEIKKGNWQAFLSMFIERLFNNMQFLGEKFEMCDKASFEHMLKRFLKMHSKPYFCQRGDRSVQRHINDVAWHFDYHVYEIDEFPKDREQAASFDKWVNSLLRNTKQSKDYFHPEEAMFIEWMQRYQQLDADNEQLIRQYFSALRRHVFNIDDRT
ncbi:DUF6933 domain-containing protein [Xenorhabdus innexi]|uniref:DUF6933 domain-containing protein n=1 Tax=Xenorhabdus innexi TaxID=290109 RepID=A0A1N6MTW3_9GAMM|nr:hypothetical protein [Xenorhabdus innexi]PHM27984.1 hypothetical protein Xinn_03898 [Xenorhabdus innexi]SIP72250.1 conserved hypothetical protein [Xenorhabdus innexi]